MAVKIYYNKRLLLVKNHYVWHKYVGLYDVYLNLRIMFEPNFLENDNLVFILVNG